MALHTFLFRVFSHQYNDINYLLSDEFINYLPWEILCTYCRTELSLSFIEQHKGKLNFTEPAFLRTHKNVLTYEFLKANVGLFNFEHPSFYELPISIELLSNYENKINWNSLSACETVDWNWEFIASHLEKFNPHRLASNRGIFEKLMLNKLTRIQIDELLNKELVKNKN